MVLREWGPGETSASEQARLLPADAPLYLSSFPQMLTCRTYCLETLR